MRVAMGAGYATAPWITRVTRGESRTDLRRRDAAPTPASARTSITGPAELSTGAGCRPTSPARPRYFALPGPAEEDLWDVLDGITRAARRGSGVVTVYG
ncbi:MAG: hypothetical protein ACRCYX_01160 [Dermatophilaceae bacterium]